MKPTRSWRRRTGVQRFPSRASGSTSRPRPGSGGTQRTPPGTGPTPRPATVRILRKPEPADLEHEPEAAPPLVPELDEVGLDEALGHWRGGTLGQIARVAREFLIAQQPTPDEREPDA